LLVIESIHLRYGESGEASAEPVVVAPINIFVGPNNSGKSRLLWEIFEYVISGRRHAESKLLEAITFQAMSEMEIAACMDGWEKITTPDPRSGTPRDLVAIRRASGEVVEVNRRNLEELMRNPAVSPGNFCAHFVRPKLVNLNGTNRVSLLDAQAGGDLQAPPQTSFQALLRDRKKRDEIRRITCEAFGSYFVLDPTRLGQLRARMSSRPPHDEVEEIGIHEGAVAFHGNARLIEEESDGVKAFVGIISQIVAGDPDLLLIDEPEAFLHPSLAFLLGREVSRVASKSRKRLFVSTHSAQFVMGCVHAGVPINIIRLTHKSQISTTRVLSSEILTRLMRNPLIRSVGALSAIFYENVIVVESDADRAFYQEINERLLRFSPSMGIANCLFLNAHSWQTIQIMVAPLRRLGISAASIYDFDIICEGGSTWARLLASSGVPEIQIQSLLLHRAQIGAALKRDGSNLKRVGVRSLSGGDREAAENFLAALAEYGIFLVPFGECEAWLSHLNAAGHGPSWLIRIFEAMGENADSPDYLKPSSNDVWNFLAQLRVWLLNPKRKGLAIPHLHTKNIDNADQ
jgi:hypothetical protein